VAEDGILPLGALGLPTNPRARNANLRAAITSLQRIERRIEDSRDVFVSDVGFRHAPKSQRNHRYQLCSDDIERFLAR
jgi:hypothetical protein